MQPSPSGILRGHRSTEERTLKLWLTLELRLFVEGEQNVESLTSCNMGSFTLWTKESLAGRQARRKLSSQSVCTHKHGSHLTLCAHFWLSPWRNSRDETVKLEANMWASDLLWPMMYGKQCFTSAFSSYQDDSACVASSPQRTRHGAGLSLTEGTQGCWERTVRSRWELGVLWLWYNLAHSDQCKKHLKQVCFRKMIREAKM